MSRARLLRPTVAFLLPLMVLVTACEERVASNLCIGQVANIDGLEVVVDKVELSDSAGGTFVGSTPQSGARYLWLHLSARNGGEAPIDKPIALRLEHRGQRVGSVVGVFYGPDHPALEPVLRLFPGIAADGWRLFEVPNTLNLAEVSAIFEYGVVGQKTVTWNLGAGGPQ